jgi:soluble lytic murein transglycosylase-like protein
MKLTLLFLLFSSSISFCADFNQFTAALAKVESSNNPKAYNSGEKAIGLYQIRPGYFLDAQKYDKELTKFSHKDCYNPQIAKRVVWAYMSRYEPQALKTGNWEILSRLHNGGCGWRTKSGKVKSNLDNYWSKIYQNLR